MILDRVLGHQHQLGDVPGRRAGDDVAQQLGLGGTQPAGPGEQREAPAGGGGLDADGDVALGDRLGGVPTVGAQSLPVAAAQVDAGERRVTVYTCFSGEQLDPSRTDAVTRHLRDDIVNWATQQPGFVSGQWLLGPRRDRGMGVVVFATEDAAFAAAQGPRSYPRDGNRAWNIEDVAVYQQVTSA
jgi:hypothetical protein